MLMVAVMVVLVVTVVAEATVAETEEEVVTAVVTAGAVVMEVVMVPVMVAVVQVWVATAGMVPRVALVVILQEIPLRVMCRVTQLRIQLLIQIQNQNQTLIQHRIRLLSQPRIQLRHPEMVLVMVVVSYPLVVE